MCLRANFSWWRKFDLCVYVQYITWAVVMMMMMGRIWVEMMDDHGPPRVRRKPLVSCHSLALTAPPPPPPYCSTAAAATTAPRLAARWMSQVKPFWCSNLDCLTSDVRTRVEKTTPGLSVSKSGTSRCPSSAPWPRTAVMLSEVQLWLLATIGDIHKTDSMARYIPFLES